jgi:hypothetical protein
MPNDLQAILDLYAKGATTAEVEAVTGERITPELRTDEGFRRQVESSRATYRLGLKARIEASAGNRESGDLLALLKQHDADRLPELDDAPDPLPQSILDEPEACSAMDRALAILAGSPEIRARAISEERLILGAPG